jgi:hypothetical protein
MTVVINNKAFEKPTGENKLLEIFYSFRGINNVDDPVNVGAPNEQPDTVFYTEAVKLVNVDPSNRAGVTLRTGRISKISSALIHSGWSNPYNPSEGYFASGSLLYHMDVNENLSIIKYDLIPGRTVDFCQVNDVIYYTNGLQSGIIEKGIDTTLFIPSLPFKQHMVAGYFPTFYNGRLYVMVDGYQMNDNTSLICSDSLDTPGGIESMDERFNIVANFEGKATMVFRVDNGLWIGTDREIFFLFGDDALFEEHSNWSGNSYRGGYKSQKSIAPYGVVSGTVRPIEGELTSIENLKGNCGIFMSNRGICICGPDGYFTNLTQFTAALESGTKGTAIVREDKGVVHYICCVQNPQDAYNPWSL